MKREISKSGLFLLELIFVILFFSISSAVCVRLFAKAHSISVQSTSVSEAVTRVTAAAESYRACSGDLEQVAGMLSGEMKDGKVTVFYDQNWDAAASKDAKYTVTIHESDENGRLKSAHIESKDSSGTILFSIDIQKFADRYEVSE